MFDSCAFKCNNCLMIKLKQHDPRYKIDTTKKVFVYKNLHKGCWSLKQGGLVKAHSDEDPIYLYECTLTVNRKGRERVLREKRKNVHAGVSGYVAEPHSSYQCLEDSDLKTEIMYNPYKFSSFVNRDTLKPIYFTEMAKVSPSSILVV